MPTTDSASAIAANTPISHIVNRDCEVWSAIRSSSVATW
jgi:hypothetical protein